MTSFRFDLHVHTGNVSPCGKVDAKEVAALYKAAGYGGIVITDHYFDGYFEGLADLPWEAKLDCFLAGYRAAQAAGAKIGLIVLLGMELRFVGSENDYLVYGVSETFLKEHPALYNLELAQFRQLMSGQGMLIYQAHPFRAGITAADPRQLDGAEVYNGNPRHNSHNDLAYRFAVRHGLLMNSGSDFHQPQDVGRGGMIFDQKITSSPELVAALCGNRQARLMGLDKAAI